MERVKKALLPKHKHWEGKRPTTEKESPQRKYMPEPGARGGVGYGAKNNTEGAGHHGQFLGPTIHTRGGEEETLRLALADAGAHSRELEPTSAISQHKAENI